ncbi:TonB-dependent receptor [Novosphingobium malaysiense]|uniref:Secretin/TonB short N-terminal domain-containing protein n=1 Tax=Novosphingobium malaysiense TaxID=1348853 RepID=A0A0B1ZIC5_9SPHN|nr:TonB-dependent receptor [Novosphingobium malaysiense]KHK89072.1 hypothetical protein LK12_22280 [Novosphingobium malaysiense]
MTTRNNGKAGITRLLLLATALAGATPACAQANDGAPYDLPAQPLGSALAALAQQAGVEIIAPADLVDGLVAPPLHQRLTAAEAIRYLLRGSGLVVRQVGGAYIVKRASGSSVASGAALAGDEIVVTGSRIRGAPIASSVVTIDAEQMRDAGHASLADVARAIPQNFGGGQNPGVGMNVPEANGADIGGGSSINLRGIGSDATLTLLNGHRLPYSSAVQSVDISAIPFDAVERIEIVADGASAIYGSDAVAGVANVILRGDYDGLRTSARLGGSTDGGNFQQQYSALAGHTWATGGLLAAYEFSRSTRITADERDYAADTAPGVTLYPYLKHHNILLSGHQRLAPGVTVSLDALYNRRWKKSTFPLNFEGDLDASRLVSNTHSNSFALAPSLQIEIGSSWRAEVQGHYGKDRVHFGPTGYLGDIVIPGGENCYCNEGKGAEIGAGGPLFALPGGSAQLALGLGWRANRLTRTSSLYAERRLSVSQDSYYGYGEATLPLAAPAQHIAGLHRLDLNAALRYERYPGIDEVVTPKLGLVYAPVAGFTLKASWGRSFRAPTLIQLHMVRGATLVPAQLVGGSDYPAGATALLLAGGNRDLKPERATSWSVTSVLEPAPLEGLRLEVSAFHVRYRDRIVTPILFLSRALSDPAFADVVNSAPSPADVSAVLALADQFTDITGGADPQAAAAIIDNRYANAARQTIAGVDLFASYHADLGAGALDLGANASLLDSKQQRGPAQPVSRLSGTIFNPPGFRARASAAWSLRGVNVLAAVNYTGGVSDARYDPVVDVAGMTTVDLTVRYRPQGGWAKGFDFTASVQNAFNARPDTIRTTLYYDTPYDSTNYSPIGRFVSLAVARTW